MTARPGERTSRPSGRAGVGAALLAGVLLSLGWVMAPTASETPRVRATVAHVRAAYFYDYMDQSHVDAIASRGFNRAVIHFVGDTLTAGLVARLRAWYASANPYGVEVVPEWGLHSIVRMQALGSTRRYTWGRGETDPGIPCPLDSAYWRSTFLDRAEAFMDAAPETQALAIDFELWGVAQTHYVVGACRCRECLAEYTGMPIGWYKPENAWRLSGLESFQESRLTHIFRSFLQEFAARHPGVEIAVLDLDKDSFVHRAFGRALAITGIPTTDYCERSYDVAGAPLQGARARLDALGLADASLVGGLWLKRFRPIDVPAALRSINEHSDGYFIFTTYSLWRDARHLDGPYTLLGRQADYWNALEEVNRSP